MNEKNSKNGKTLINKKKPPSPPPKKKERKKEAHGKYGKGFYF